MPSPNGGSPPEHAATGQAAGPEPNQAGPAAGAEQPASPTAPRTGPAPDAEQPGVVDTPQPEAAPSVEAPAAVPDASAPAPAEQSPVPAAPAAQDAAATSPTPPDPSTGEQAATAAPLTAGAVVADRYTIIEAITADRAGALLNSPVDAGTAELFAVEDGRGYERCWSCGSTGNGEQQRFCVECGAPLQHHQLVLARSGEPTGEAEEFAEGGSYFHLVAPRKRFGSTGITLEVGGYSAEGPHHPNEDSFWYASMGGCYDSVNQAIAVVALADGMGGYAPGSGLISKVIVGTVGRGIFSLLNEEEEAEIQETQLQVVVKTAIAEANGKVLTEIRQHGEMGATLVTAVIHGQTAYVANIGDSRAYYIAPSGVVTQVTRDQSLIEQQVAAGLLSPDAVYTAFGNNVILHAIGEEDVEDMFDWYVQPLEPGSRLMLCSDGYWKTMQHEVWDGEAAVQQSTLRNLARAMVEGALARDSDDNTTVLLVGID